MLDVLKFWLDLGVDGFRVDAVIYLVEDIQFRSEGKNRLAPPQTKLNDYAYLVHDKTSNQPETYDIVKSWAEFLKDYGSKHNKEIFMMTESYKTVKVYGSCSFFTCSFMYAFHNFPLQQFGFFRLL